MGWIFNVILPGEDDPGDVHGDGGGEEDDRGDVHGDGGDEEDEAGDDRDGWKKIYWKFKYSMDI